MRLGLRFQRRRSVATLVVGMALAWSAPAFAAEAGSASDSGGLLDTVFETLNLKTKVGPTPDFVEATHPDPSTLHFIPTGTPHPKRPVAVKSADDVEAAKAALDAARDAQLLPRPKPAPPPKTKAGKLRATAAPN